MKTSCPPLPCGPAAPTHEAAQLAERVRGGAQVGPLLTALFDLVVPEVRRSACKNPQPNILNRNSYTHPPSEWLYKQQCNTQLAAPAPAADDLS